MWRALLLVALVGAPAVALRLACAGRACAQASDLAAAAPFCSLPPDLRDRIVQGFYDGRSPNVFMVSTTKVRGAQGLGGLAMPWPSIARERGDRVPIVFGGWGVQAGGLVPAGTGLEDVAPTIAEIIGLHRPHPRVRSGKAVSDVVLRTSPPRLVLEIVLDGVGSRDLESARGTWPNLAGVLRSGAGTLDGRIAALPLDPAAVLTTLGTGGVPQEHGIPGTFVLNDQGKAVRAWGRDAPPSVIATLGNHLDQLMEQRPRIGIVATDISQRGAIGGSWYTENDRDDVVIRPASAPVQASAALSLLDAGYGSDPTTDLLVVVLRDDVRSLDRAIGRVVRGATQATGGGTTVVVTATGSAMPRTDRYVTGAEVVRELESELAGSGDEIEALVVGGLFLDQRLRAEGAFSEEQVLDALRQLPSADGAPLFADIFRSTSITFARYC